MKNSCVSDHHALSTLGANSSCLKLADRIHRIVANCILKQLPSSEDDGCDVYLSVNPTAIVRAQFDEANNKADLPYFLPGRILFIYGQAPRSGSFTIDLRPVYDDNSEDVIFLRITVDLDSYHVSRDSFIHGKWLGEEENGYSGILPRRFFVISVLIQTYGYEIAIEGYHFATYYHRIAITKDARIEVSENVPMDPVEFY